MAYRHRRRAYAFPAQGHADIHLHAEVGGDDFDGLAELRARGFTLRPFSFNHCLFTGRV